MLGDLYKLMKAFFPVLVSRTIVLYCFADLSKFKVPMTSRCRCCGKPADGIGLPRGSGSLSARRQGAIVADSFIIITTCASRDLVM